MLRLIRITAAAFLVVYLFYRRSSFSQKDNGSEVDGVGHRSGGFLPHCWRVLPFSVWFTHYYKRLFDQIEMAGRMVEKKRWKCFD